jgi:hypothetical protein
VLTTVPFPVGNTAGGTAQNLMLTTTPGNAAGGQH